MDLGLNKKNCVVFAASKGLGFACAKTLAEEGANVAICSRSATNVEHAIKELKELNQESKMIGSALDYTNPAELAFFINQTKKEFGSIDVLVWNSGGPKGGKAEELSSENFVDTFESSVAPAIAATQLVLPEMKQQNWGRIIYITTSGVAQPIAGLALSNTSRSALTSYAKTLSAEVAKNGVLVNAVMPGRFATDRHLEVIRIQLEKSGTSVEEQEKIALSKIPMNRYGNPDEFGAFVAFLASQKSSYMTGGNFAVDGGAIIGMR